MLYSALIDWVVFKGSKFDWFLGILHSKILLTACTDQLLYKPSLIIFACLKQNTTVKTASDVCSLLAKSRLSDLVGQRPSSLINNFEQVIKPFLV